MYRTMLFYNKRDLSKISHYDMDISEAEKQIILNLVAHVDDDVISKKHLYEDGQPKYTLLKVGTNTFLMIGDGERTTPSLSKNALLGRGLFSRVKGGVRVELNSSPKDFEVDPQDYAIKIYNLSSYKAELHDPYTELKKEASFYKKLYGYGEAVISKDKQHYYLVMPRLPGLTLKHLDFAHFSLQDIYTCLSQIFAKVNEMHNLKITHGDLHYDNVQYDERTQSASIIDFGMSRDQTDSFDQSRDWFKLLYCCHYKLLNCISKYDETYQVPKESLKTLANFFNNKYGIDNLDYSKLAEDFKQLYESLATNNNATPRVLN